MKENLKRVAALLAMSAVTVSGLAACGNTEVRESEESVPASVSSEATSEAVQESTMEEEEFTYPSDDGWEISIWTWLNGNVGANYTGVGETEWAKGLSERTGIACDWQDSATTDEDYNIMIASGDYCDLIEENMLTKYPGGPAKAIEDEVIVPLNDIIEQYCPNLKAYLEANPDIDKQIKTDDGIYYCFPKIGSVAANFTLGNYLRGDWLEEVGMDVPVTIDDWYNVLTAFKTELGVEAPYTSTWNYLLKTGQFAYAYGVPSNHTYRLVLDDAGKCVFVPTADNYKELLMTLNKWYTEGLIDKDIVSIANDSVKTKMVSGDAGASCGWLASGMQSTMIAGMEADSEYALVATAVPQVVEGKAATDVYTSFQFNGAGFALTTGCENVEAAARFIDYMYSEEGIIYANFGTEGVSYNVVDGKYVYTDDVLVNYPEGWSLSQSVARYSRAASGGLPIVHDEYYPQTLILDETKAANELWMNSVEDPFKHMVPAVTLTTEESDVVAKLGNELLTYVDEMSVQFVLGTLSFDEWDNYVETINGMGVNDILETYDAAVARYNAR